MIIKLNDVAPDFTLRTSNHEVSLTLSSLKGKKNVLLLFFPFAFTGVCTKELCSVRDNYQIYVDKGVEVIGISVDSPFVLAKFKEEQKLNYTLLSDFNAEVSKKYNVVYDEFLGWMQNVSKRAAFLIDKNQIVRYQEILENPLDLPNFFKINQALLSIV